MQIRNVLAAMIAAVTFSMTPFAVVAASAPTINEAIAQGSNIDVTWTNVGAVDSFSIQHSCDGGVTWLTIDFIPAKERAWTVETDGAAENCVVRMASRVDNITGIYSDPVTPMSNGSSSPSNVTIDATNGTIVWDASAAREVVAYEVQMSTDEGATWKIVGTASSAASQLRLPSIPEGAAFRVTAIDADGQRFTGDIQRALDAEASDIVRTASVADDRLRAIAAVVALLAIVIIVVQARRRRTARLTHGFEDFDALTRR